MCLFFSGGEYMKMSKPIHVGMIMGKWLQSPVDMLRILNKPFIYKEFIKI